MDAPMVWVISSDVDTRRLIELNLSKRGLRTLEASTQGGLALSGADPQLIVLDVDKPERSSAEAAAALREVSQLQEVPLILVLTSAPAASLLLPLQPIRWLEKPLDMDALLAAVRESTAWEEPTCQKSVKKAFITE